MKFKIGDKVILGKHLDSSGNPYNWQPAMDQYVGKIATITTIVSPIYVRVDLDQEQWVWEPAFLKLAKRDLQNDGCRCSKCREWVPYVEPSDTFVCYSCKRRP